MPFVSVLQAPRAGVQVKTRRPTTPASLPAQTHGQRAWRWGAEGVTVSVSRQHAAHYGRPRDNGVKSAARMDAKASPCKFLSLALAHAWGRRRTRGSGVGACAGVEESLGILELAQRGGLAA